MASERHLRDYLTHDEVVALLRSAKKSPRYGARNYAMILLAYRHGLRASELVNLRVSHLDLPAGTIALSNNRLVSCNNNEVRFRYKDYAHGNQRKVMTLVGTEFIRRFLLHVLPTGFMRLRHYGILANRTKRAQLAQARAALDCAPPAPAARAPESVPAFWLRIAQRDITLCPHCRVGHLRIVGQLARTRPPAQAPPRPA